MCQFKSGVAVRINETDVLVRTLIMNDSFSDICKNFGIKEDDSGQTSCYAFVELIPTKLDFKDLSCWHLVFYDPKPDWWTEWMTEQCVRQLLQTAKADIDELTKGKKYNGDLLLKELISIPEGFNPKVIGNLDLDGLTSVPRKFRPTVGGSLWLGSLTSVPEDFNPTVEWDLRLDGMTSISPDCTFNVEGFVYLNSQPQISDNSGW